MTLDFHGVIVAFTIKTDMGPARLKDYLETNPRVLGIAPLQIVGANL